jgi:hypothetical protein
MNGRLAGRNAITRPVLLASLLIAGAAFGLLVLDGSSFEGPRERSGRGKSPEEVKGQLYQKIDFPRGASDVNFRSTVRVTRLDFKVAEADALAWIRDHQWKPRPVTEDDPTGYTLDNGESRDPLVYHGFRFDSQQQCGLAGVFDRDAERMSVSYFCR